MNVSTADGCTFHVEQRGAGIPLLFVHGFPLNHSMWQAQIDAFSDSYRVIALDLRGFGETSTGTSDIVTMDEFADDLNAVLDGLQITEPIVYCGLSMGGYIGFRFLEKYGNRLRGLILCDTRPQADSEEAVKTRIALAKNVLHSGPQPAIDAMLPKLVSEKTREENPAIVEQLREMIAATDRRSIAAALHGMARRPDSTPLLHGIEIPALVLCGAEDILTPPDVMRAMADEIPHARYVEIPNAGHMSPMEDATAVNNAIREFLESLPAG